MGGYKVTTRISTTLDDKFTIITTHDEPNYSTVQASPRGPCLSPAGSLGGSDDQPATIVRLPLRIAEASLRPRWLHAALRRHWCAFAAA